MDAPREKAAKDTQLGVRIPNDLRAALEAEAAATGRTMSQVAIRWMEQARSRGDAQASLPGGNIGDALQRMARFADAIRKEVGDPDSSLAAYMALTSGWARLAKDYPLPAPGPEERALGAARGPLLQAASRLLDALRAVAQDPAHDDLLAVFATPQEPSALGLLLAPNPDPRERLSLIELLLELDSDGRVSAELMMKRLGEALERHGRELGRHAPVLNAIRDVQKAAHDEIDAQLASIKRLKEALQKSEDLVRAMLRQPKLADLINDASSDPA